MKDNEQEEGMEKRVREAILGGWYVTILCYASGSKSQHPLVEAVIDRVDHDEMPSSRARIGQGETITDALTKALAEHDMREGALDRIKVSAS